MADERDVTYSTVGGAELKLDIFRPAAGVEPRRAAILFFHGGGWRAGSRAAMEATARTMSGYGYVGLPVQYRLLGDAPYPAQIDDVKAAIRWGRNAADRLDIEPRSIILWGSSAGAHLSLLAAGTPDGAGGVSTDVAAVIAEHPPVEFHVGDPTSRHTTNATSLLGEGCSEDAARAASPITHVSANFPPTLLLHGTYDRMVNHSASEAFMTALRSVKAPVELHLFHGHNHGFVNVPSIRRQVAAEAEFFLDRTLFNVDRYRAETLEHSMFARRAAEAKRGNEGKP